jgi:hypothetical protein
VGNSCVEGREVKWFNVIVWGIVVSKVEKSNVLMLLREERDLVRMYSTDL